MLHGALYQIFCRPKLIDKKKVIQRSGVAFFVQNRAKTTKKVFAAQGSQHCLRHSASLPYDDAGSAGLAITKIKN